MGYDAPNYTQTPNAFFEALPDLSEAELRIGLAVIRKTFGWHKRSDKISLTQFQELTGMSRQGVLNGVNGLIDKEVMARQEDGDSFKYALVVNEVDQGSQRGRPPLVNEVDTQKKGLNKDHQQQGRDLFDFVRGRDRESIEHIRRLHDKYKDFPDRLFARVVGSNTASVVASPVSEIEKYGWPKVCAALVRAGVRKQSKWASWSFYEKIRDSLDEEDGQAKVTHIGNARKDEPEEGTDYLSGQVRRFTQAGYPEGAFKAINRTDWKDRQVYRYFPEAA